MHTPDKHPAVALADSIKASGQFTDLKSLDEAAEILRRMPEIEAQLKALRAQSRVVYKCPESFRDYITGNYSGNVYFHDSAWHAERIWKAAMYSISSAPTAPEVEKPPYTTIDMGYGKWEVGAGTNAGTPCIAFGKNGSGRVGELVTIEPRQMSVEETYAVITFANVQGLDVLQEKMDEVRAIYFSDTTPTEGDKV